MCKMRIKTPLHFIVNTVETIGLSVSSVSECKLNSADADPYFHVHSIALWDLLFCLSQKNWSLLDEVVDLNGPDNMVV